MEDVQTAAAVCENSQPLVSGSDPVPDSAFTASSSHSNLIFGPEKSRITNSGETGNIWHPATGQWDGAWIQVSYMYNDMPYIIFGWPA